MPRKSGNESRIEKHSESIWIAVGALAVALGIAIAVLSTGGAAAEITNESVTVNDSAEEVVWIDVEATNTTNVTVELVDDTGTPVNSTTLNATGGETSSVEFDPAANGTYNVTVNGTAADVSNVSVGVESSTDDSGGGGFLPGGDNLAIQAIVGLVLAVAAVAGVDYMKEV